MPSEPSALNFACDTGSLLNPPMISSSREKEILKCLVEGMSYKLIAGNCFISIDTVHGHIKNIYKKLQVHSKGEAVAKAIKGKIV